MPPPKKGKEKNEEDFTKSRKPVEQVASPEDAPALSRYNATPKSLFSLWSDEDIQNEDWFTHESPFEDTEGNQSIPLNAQHEVEWKRPSEYLPELQEDVENSENAKGSGKGKQTNNKNKLSSGPKHAHIYFPQNDLSPEVAPQVLKYHREWSESQKKTFKDWEAEESRVKKETESKYKARSALEEALRLRAHRNDDSDIDISDSELQDDGDDEDDELQDGRLGISIDDSVQPNLIELPETPEGENVDSLMAAVFDVVEANKHSLSESTPFLWQSIYPQDENRHPIYNPGGKYCVKLFAYGSWRKVDVDDRIPLNADGKPKILSSSNIAELWPTLLTKAIYKMVKFTLGSHSKNPAYLAGIVLAITGWGFHIGSNARKGIDRLQEKKSSENAVHEADEFSQEVPQPEVVLIISPGKPLEEDICRFEVGSALMVSGMTEEGISISFNKTQLLLPTNYLENDKADLLWKPTEVEATEECPGGMSWAPKISTGSLLVSIDTSNLNVENCEVLFQIDVLKAEEVGECKPTTLAFIPEANESFEPTQRIILESDSQSSTLAKLKSGGKYAYRIYINDNNCGFTLTAFSKAIISILDISEYLKSLCGLQTRLVNGTYNPFFENQRTILLRQKLEASSKATIRVCLMLEEPRLSHCVQLCLIDNDTGETQESPLLDAKFDVSPNHKGYTVFASCCYRFSNVPAGNWKLLVAYEGSEDTISELELTQAPCYTNFTGIYEPNRLCCCFQDILLLSFPAGRLSSATTVIFSTKYPCAVLNLQVLDPESMNVLMEVHGKQPVQINHLPPINSQSAMKETKYIIQGSFDKSHWIIPKELSSQKPFNDGTPLTPVEAKTEIDPSVNSLLWEVKICSDASQVSLLPDTKRLQERISLKNDWESSQSGRGAISRICRLWNQFEVEAAEELLKELPSELMNSTLARLQASNEVFGGKDKKQLTIRERELASFQNLPNIITEGSRISNERIDQRKGQILKQLELQAQSLGKKRNEWTTIYDSLGKA